MNKTKIIVVLSCVLLLTSLAFNNMEVKNKQKISELNNRIDKLEKLNKEMNKQIKDDKIKAKAIEDKLNKELKNKNNLIEEKENKINSLSRGGNFNNGNTFILTFYTDLEEENSSAGPITCTGKRLNPGMVANNVLPLGTKIKLKDYGEVYVADKGGDNFNTSNRLDVFIPRNDGESNYEYKNRINNMGKQIVPGYIVK